MLKPSMKIQLVWCILFIIVTKLAAQTPSECSAQKGLWVSKKYSYSDELIKLVSSTKSNNDKLCAKNTCCDSAMQIEMVGVSQLVLKKIAQSHMSDVMSFLLNMSDRFHDMFQANLDSSRTHLDQMFLTTYTQSYKSNQPFFFDFYEKLKRYMAGSENNIEKMLENFFHEMAEKILNMMTLSSKDAETIRCMTNNFLKLDPYQNIDKSIIASFKSAYPPARMIVNGLRAAHDVFYDLMKNKMTPSAECASAYAKAFHCSLCSTAEVLPCDGLCKSIMGKCFGSLNVNEMMKLNRSWKKLLVAMGKLADKLRGPFNFPEINKNLHVKISDAIMNVHNFYPTVRDKISGNCANILLVRKRRSENGDFNQQFQSVPGFTNGFNRRASDLSEIIGQFSTSISNMTKHFQRTKTSVCSNLNLPKTGQSCWNGAESTNAYKPDPKDKSQIKNLPLDPQVKSSIEKLNEISKVITDLANSKNQDPSAFKIKYVEKPKPPQNPRLRSSRVSDSIEGSGNGDREVHSFNANLNTKAKKEPAAPPPPQPPPAPLAPPAPKEKPIFSPPTDNIIEGSGNKKAMEVTPTQKEKATFPEIAPPNENTQIKKPPISDDEDLVPPIDLKPKTGNQIKGSKPPIEGSGAQETPEMTTRRILPMITTTTTQTPTTESRKPDYRDHKENNLAEGSGQGPDDDLPQNRPDDYSKLPTVNMPTTSTSREEPITTNGVALPNELPGEIPNEIWIPRVVDYDSYGKIATNQNSEASHCRLGTPFVHFVLFISVCVYILH